MKKLFAISLIVLASAAIFTSCKKDDTTAAAPTISVTNNKTAYSITATADTTITFNVTVAADGKISTFTITKTVGSITTSYGSPSGFSGETSYTYNFNETFHASDTYPISFAFKVTDKNDQSATITVTVSKIQGSTGNPISTFTGKQLGGASNTSLPSYINLTTGTTYLDGTSCASVDLIFTYSSTNGNLMAAPNDATIDQAFPDIDNWSTKNATKFTALLSGITWANVTNDALITANVTTTAAANTRINNLAVGNIFGFITAAGKKGLINITAIAGTTGTDRSITFDIKVQQ
jgi:hypothetical protein